jgi:hypothetical protein
MILPSPQLGTHVLPDGLYPKAVQLLQRVGVHVAQPTGQATQPLLSSKYSPSEQVIGGGVNFSQ